MTDTLQIIVAVIGVGVAILLALVTGAWNLRGRLERLGARLERVESRSVNQLQAIPILCSAAVPALRQAQGERYHTVRGELVEPQRCISGCPLTPDEARSFRELMAKARRGEFFSREEVDEYDALIRKIRAEHPDAPRIWPLVTLGAFLQGIYPGSRRRDAP